MAVDETLSTYSTSAGSNTPGGATNVGPDLDNHLRDIKKNIRLAAEASQGATQPASGFRGQEWLDTSGTATNKLTFRLHDGTAFTAIFDVDPSASVVSGINLKDSAIASTKIDFSDSSIPSTVIDFSSASGSSIPAEAVNLGLTVFGASLIDDPSAGAARTTMGLGTAALENTGTTAGDVPELVTGSATSIAALPTLSGEFLTNVGAMEFVSTAAITAASAIVVTGMAAGFDYIVVLEAIAPNTDADELWMRFSDDAGVSYEAGASDYGWQVHLGALDQNSNADTKIAISGTGGGGTSLGNDAGNVNTVEVTLPNPNASSEKTTCFWKGITMGDAATPDTVDLFGGGIFLQGNDAVAAIQFLWSSGGNFKAQGDITVYRRRRS